MTAILGVLVVGSLLGIFFLRLVDRVGWRSLLPRGEIAETPEEEAEEMSVDEVREAVLTALSDPAVVRRRLTAMTKTGELRDLRDLSGRIERLYVNGADR